MSRGWALSIIFACVTLAACRQAATTPPKVHSHESGPLTWTVAGATGDITLDPTLATDAASVDVCDLLYEGLVRLNGRLQVVPAAAVSWHEFDRGLRYRFRLRPGLRFSNGRPVNPGDVVGSFRRALAGGGFVASGLNEVARVGGRPAIFRTGRQSVEFRLSHPSPAFLAKLTLVGGSIVDTRTLARYGTVWTAHVDGLGPYRLRSWIPGGSVTLSPDPYFRPRPPGRALIVRFAPKAQALTDFEAKRTDVVTNLPANTRLTASARLSAQWSQLPALDFILTNSAHSPLNNSHLRRALALAVDRDHLTREVFGSSAVPVGSVVPPSLLSEASVQTYNPRLAVRELDQAGSPSGRHLRSLRLVYLLTPTEELRAHILHSMWSSVLGIRVQLVGLDYGAYLRAIDSGRFDMATVSWGSQYPDAADFLDFQLHGGSPGDLSRWNNVRFDRLIDRSRLRGVDSVARRRDLLSAAHIASQEAPWIPLDSPLQVALVRESAIKLALTPIGLMGLAPGTGTSTDQPG